MNKSKTKRITGAFKRKLLASESSQNKGKFQCWCCLKTFKEESLRRQHMRLHDPSLQTFSCTICLLSFPSRIAYNNHLKTDHQSSTNSNEPGMIEKQQSVCPSEQTTWNNKNIHELRLHDRKNHSSRNNPDSCPDDTNLRIESTFSLRDELREFGETPVEFIDVNKTLKSIEQQQHHLSNSFDIFNDNERTQDQQKHGYCTSRNLKDFSDDVMTENNDDVDFCDLTLDSDDFEDYDGEVDDDGGSEEELSIYDVIIVGDDGENDFTASKKRSWEN
ncbi:hypothetical protein LSTR_LSTR010967 [Laodelphax striatellus]|uniref:C2H2-type domain-containing protein n=1 Tax=Laodelphax striatellus TaxID=195883 RepID=A0A482XI19_LAOST|nr:hypothetical protein LSTR_LSTR010967 [Laodelphax striatellus]